MYVCGKKYETARRLASGRSFFVAFSVYFT